MPALKRNHRHVIAARAIDGKRTQYRIEGVNGLVLDVRANGKRTWFVRYQPGGRKSRTFRWYKIGDATTIGLADAATARGKSSLPSRMSSAIRLSSGLRKCAWG